jgi:hypothetical protein
MNTGLRIFVTLILLLLYKNVFAQHSSPDSIHAFFISSNINFNGELDEPEWQQATGIENFIQRELDFGKPVTEKTRVVVLYDRLALYIGVWCYQQNAKKINAKFLQRDYDVDADDGFAVIISPFNDKRTGYLFVINPLGARADYLVSGNEDANKNWNGVWDAKTTISNEGWFAEIRIPFNSLQFKNVYEHRWAINFERAIRYKNEDVLWQGWTRDCSINCLVNAGVLTGIRNIGYAKRFELKPYLSGGFDKNQSNGKTSWPGKLGADLNVNLSPTLKLNLTTNTDFAQVEADRIAVNLTRFNLYYPEKREFFLEGYQNYQFALGGDNQVFYTRRIGIESFEPVSIIGGARIFGKVQRNNIGFLNIETAKKDTIPATNNTVLRYRRDIGEQSYIGGIITSKNNSLISNQVAGIDASYATSHFIRNKNLVITGLAAKSFDKDKSGNQSMAYRFFIDYPNDIVDNFIGISSIQPNFDPQLGFLQRSNFDKVQWNLNYAPRIFKKCGVKRMRFKPWEFTYYRTHNTGQFESLSNETRPFGFITKSGETFEFNLQQFYDRLNQPFNLTDSIIIPKGKYWMNRTEFQIESFTARPVWGAFNYNWGKFYTGHIKTLELQCGVNANRHLYFETIYTYNYITLPQAKVTTNELVQYISYGFTTKLDLTLFVQWNSLDDILFGNFRLHWIPKIGSDFYFVYNRGYDQVKQIDFLKPAVSTGIGKLVWRFTF